MKVVSSRKKEKVIAILGIASALVLLVGCERQEKPKQTEQEERDTASQVQQDIEEEGLSNEL
ncbi:MAG: hypothetical protein K2N90_06625 [Lachnospiraceae bacterium]|nr:hypothetical protein [Lachnospiraceae bacterium]